MVDKEQIEKLINEIDCDLNSNLTRIKNTFKDVYYKDRENQTLLHIFVDDKYDEYKCFKAIKTLLTYGLNPNAESDFGYNFIQTALYTGYSEKFILAIIKAAFPKGLETNHVDEDGDTMAHTAIYSDDYKERVDRIYQLLVEYGLDSNIKDNNGRNLVDAMKSEKKFTKSQISEFKRLFDSNIANLEEAKKVYEDLQNNEEKTNDEEVNTFNDNFEKQKVKKPIDKIKLSEYGVILTDKFYRTSPTIGREQELKNLMVTLALDKKSPIVVGESGVGKTALVQELAYRIQNGNVPNFLKEKVIIEINPNDLVAGCEYVGQFEKKIKKLMSLCDNEDVILFIDEIHTIYGVGTTKNNDNDLSTILRHYMDRMDFKIIGTTTKEEYNKYFSNSSFKRRLERVEVKEPEKELLYQIINKVINDNCNNKKIKFENESIKNEIINIIVEATSKKGRVYDDQISNPDLAISIIDKAFAFALVYDTDYIKGEHFIESFKCNDRIYKSRSEEAISKLEKIDTTPKKVDSKILKINFNGRKK